MKPILTYALIFVISLSLSVFLHHFSAADAGQDSLGEGMSFAKEDIHRLVDHEFAEKRDAALMDDFGDQRLLLGPLERGLDVLLAALAVGLAWLVQELVVTL